MSWLASRYSKPCGRFAFHVSCFLRLQLCMANPKDSASKSRRAHYPTRDGTCVRDYIHVSDLARAHVLALALLSRKSDIFNLGCGGGYTVLEVIEAARQVTGHPIPIRIGPRRLGDPAVLIASSEKIQRELGWQPQQQDLSAVIESAWKGMRTDT
jgi:UDP-glucose 4-epimerase